MHHAFILIGRDCDLIVAHPHYRQGLIGVRELEDSSGALHARYLSSWVAASRFEACTGDFSSGARYCRATATHALSTVSSFFADAVLLWAHALQAAPAHVRRDPDVMYHSHVRSAAFEGVSGRVVLDDSADRKGRFEIVNLRIFYGDALRWVERGRRLGRHETASERKAGREAERQGEVVGEGGTASTSTSTSASTSASTFTSASASASASASTSAYNTPASHRKLDSVALPAGNANWLTIGSYDVSTATLDLPCPPPNSVVPSGAEADTEASDACEPSALFPGRMR